MLQRNRPSDLQMMDLSDYHGPPRKLGAFLLSATTAVRLLPSCFGLEEGYTTRPTRSSTGGS